MTDDKKQEAAEKAEEPVERGGVVGWLADRFGWVPFAKRFLYHRETKTPWYYGDGSTLLMLLGILVLTGSFLALDYAASPEAAYQSVVTIEQHNALGWFVRAVHYWSAGFMVVIVVAHALRQILLGGYKPPREATWLVGVALFVLVIVNAYIGYTLRWDERAVYAIRVALHIFYFVPVIGDELVRFVQGGLSIGSHTLSRFYAVHVLFVPLALLGLSAYHLYLVVVHGVTTPAERRLPVESAEEARALRDHLKKRDDTGTSFFPDTVAKSGSFALIAFALIVVLSILSPAPLGEEANLVETTIPEEEWWWHWFSAMAAYLPPAIAPYVYVLLPLAVLGIMVLLPFVDRGPNRGLRRRPFATVAVIGVVVALLGLTQLRFDSSFLAWPRTDLAPLPEGVQLAPSSARGHELFTTYGCYNCHAVGGRGSKVGPNLTDLGARLSPQELRRYVQRPPEGVAMPAYEGHMPEADLQAVVDFVLVAQTFPRSF